MMCIVAINVFCQKSPVKYEKVDVTDYYMIILLPSKGRIIKQTFMTENEMSEKSKGILYNTYC